MNKLSDIDGTFLTVWVWLMVNTFPVPTNQNQAVFFNYKGFNSTNLLAIVDSNYKFIYVDVREYGSNTGGNVFKFSRFMDYKLDVPSLERLPNIGQEGLLPLLLGFTIATISLATWSSGGVVIVLVDASLTCSRRSIFSSTC